ncbi:S-adenosylhomocysteine hydrolase [Vibrio metoecus]|uniref:DUF3653 domain-containing protein n=1 Tax=Vibrio metoecus TaxID=1481663 RepID=UPI0006D82E50|nr:DUF3653 domain-containing protein [Vibrio metoecus]EJU9029127.1 S-adenosylhomocysteine hydrolase [Vibrio cholerae]ELJ8507865.1 S-adenosylhomocysteine hydrolase [Vibrio cholerae]KQB00764.1 S-adenosylhomocysteine hydrolase [Vibrio metoecus]MCR9386237.1 phage protein [Vibrio metoecus]PAR55991.1 S-adenosylhomocysteine hydrolase [Vibrio metoecus]
MTRKVRDELYHFGLHINQVQDLLLWHFDSDAEAAEYFGVTPQTVKNWKKKRNWPLAVVRLLLIKHRGYLPVSKAWREFKIRGDVLYTPGGRALNAYDLMGLDIKVDGYSNVYYFHRKKTRNRNARYLGKFKNRAMIRPK